MSADGNWKITINTPMGAQTVDAAITTNGDTFTGTTSGQMGTQSVEGKVNGDTLTWSSSIVSMWSLVRSPCSGWLSRNSSIDAPSSSSAGA